MIKILSVTIFLLYFNSCTYSQSSECLYLFEGYILEVTENNRGQLTTAVDYFYYKNIPELDSSFTPLTLYRTGGKIVNIKHLFDINLEKMLTKGYKLFYTDSKSVVKTYKSSKFSAKLFRVQMAAFKKNERLDDRITSWETSHSYSYLINLPKKELEKEINVIYPEIIKSW